MKLSFYINLILELENVPVLSEKENSAIDGFDTSILILDDMDDGSKTRDGKPCYYITHGEKKARQKAQKLSKEAFSAINTICNKRKLGFVKKIQARFLFKRLWKDIEKGQALDSFLQNTKNVSTDLLEKYDLMIRLFTGGHIKYGFLIGYIFSGKNPKYKNTVANIGEKIGLIRQIQDDINDYEQKHHEPLGDLMNHKKRLPELLFLLTADQQEKDRLQKALEQKIPAEEIKNIIFNNKVKIDIEKKIYNIVKDIESKVYSPPIPYQEKLTLLIKTFQHS